MERTCGHARSALDTLALVDDERRLDHAAYRADRAAPGALGAALALVGLYLNTLQLLADAGRTALLVDVRLVLVAEILYRADNG